MIANTSIRRLRRAYSVDKLTCFNIYSATITCGNIKLTDVELQLHTSDDFTSLLIYHCAESISANQNITSVCSNDGDSLWNSDLARHGCANVSTGAAGRLRLIASCMYPLSQASSLIIQYTMLCNSWES